MGLVATDDDPPSEWREPKSPTDSPQAECGGETENWTWPKGVKLLALKQLTKSDINLERGTLTLRSTQGEKMKEALGGTGEVVICDCGGDRHTSMKLREYSNNGAFYISGWGKLLRAHKPKQGDYVAISALGPRKEMAISFSSGGSVQPDFGWLGRPRPTNKTSPKTTPQTSPKMSPKVIPSANLKASQKASSDQAKKAKSKGKPKAKGAEPKGTKRSVDDARAGQRTVKPRGNTPPLKAKETPKAKLPPKTSPAEAKKARKASPKIEPKSEPEVVPTNANMSDKGLSIGMDPAPDFLSMAADTCPVEMTANAQSAMASDHSSLMECDDSVEPAISSQPPVGGNLGNSLANAFSPGNLVVNKNPLDFLAAAAQLEGTLPSFHVETVGRVRASSG